MEVYIKTACIHKKGTPTLYGSKDYMQWLEQECTHHGFQMRNTIETIIQNMNHEPMNVMLIELNSTDPNRSIHNVIEKLSYIVDATKISMPWINNCNIYATNENYQEVQELLRIHKLKPNIIETRDMEVTWFHGPKLVKFIQFDCDVPDALKQSLKKLANLFSLHISFAYPWHQFWYVAECQQIDSLILDVCANYWAANTILSEFDMFDLVQLQIAIRGPIENHYLYRHITKLIDGQLDHATKRFNVNTYLFECDKAKVHEDTILYFIYYYGRHFKEIIWLYDGFSGTKRFDDCLKELNIKIVNHQNVEVNLTKYKSLPVDQLMGRFWNVNRIRYTYTVNIGNYSHFDGDFFVSLLRADSIDAIHFDVGYQLNYSTKPKNRLEYEEFHGNAESKQIIVSFKPRQKMGLYNGLCDFIGFFKFIMGRNGDYGQKYFHLILNGVVVENWSIFTDLNILSLTLQNMELNVQDLEDLANCTRVCPTMEFVDCENLNDSMLLKFVCRVADCDRIKISGKSSITKLFFYMRAESKMEETGTNEYDFSDELPVIEMDRYDHIAEAKYYKWDKIVCLEDDDRSDDEDETENVDTPDNEDEFGLAGDVW